VALFDVFSVLLADFPIEVLNEKKPSIEAGARGLLDDSRFEDAISRSTNSTRNVHIRFDFAKEMLEKVLS